MVMYKNDLVQQRKLQLYYTLQQYVCIGKKYCQTNCPSRHKGGALAGFRGSTIQKSWKPVRLAPTLVHVCGFIWEWTYAKCMSPLTTPGGISGGGVGGHKFKNLRKLSNCCTDWHDIWYKSADSSGNRHRQNTIRPSLPQGVLGGHKFKCLGKLSNSWTDWHHIWYSSADSSRNGHRLNTIRPSISQGAFGGGGLGGHKFKSMLKLSNCWPDCHKCGKHVQIHLGMDIRQTNCPSRHNGGHLGIVGGQTFKSLEKLSNSWTDWHQIWYISADLSGNGHS